MGGRGVYSKPGTCGGYTPTEVLYLLASRLWCYALLTLITCLGVLHFCYGAVTFPIKLVSPTLFRKITTLYLYFTVPGFLCVAFS